MREEKPLKVTSWKNVTKVLKDTHNFSVDRKQMKNHYDYQKGKYGAWAKLKHKTGNVYNPSTNMFNLSEEEWEIEMKTNKYVEPLRSTPLAFPHLCTQLFDGVAATGVDSWGPSSSSKRSRTCDQPITIEEDTNEPQETPSSTPYSHKEVKKPTKKAKASDASNLEAVQEDMSKLMRFMIEKNSGPSETSEPSAPKTTSYKDCCDKLRSLGWGPRNPLHQTTLVMFADDGLRELWMEIQPEEAELWVQNMASFKGIKIQH